MFPAVAQTFQVNNQSPAGAGGGVRSLRHVRHEVPVSAEVPLVSLYRQWGKADTQNSISRAAIRMSLFATSPCPQREHSSEQPSLTFLKSDWINPTCRGIRDFKRLLKPGVRGSSVVPFLGKKIEMHLDLYLFCCSQFNWVEANLTNSFSSSLWDKSLADFLWYLPCTNVNRLFKLWQKIICI